MTKKFSLIKAINDVTNNRSLDEVAKEVVRKGVEEMRKSGLAIAGSIQLPVMETENEEVRAMVYSHRQQPQVLRISQQKNLTFLNHFVQIW